MKSISVEAIFDNGVLRPTQALPLHPQQRVTIIVELPGAAVAWPEDVAAIYKEIADEDRRLAAVISPAALETWPVSEGQP